MDNIVGSLDNFFFSEQGTYILGLWGADRYFRTSSIGLSSTNLNLVHYTLEYFLKYFSQQRIKVRVYGKEVPDWLLDFDVSYCKGVKNKITAFHLYVNSRELVRNFRFSLDCRNEISPKLIPYYFAGRFDGDGSYDHSRRMLRIVYSNNEEAEKDILMLNKIRVKISMYRYKKANTFCLYFKRETLENFISQIQKISISGKLQ